MVFDVFAPKPMFSLCFCIVCAWTHVFFNGFQHMLMQNLCCCYARHGIYVLVKSRNLASEATSLKVSSFIKAFKRKSMLWEEAAKIDFNSFATSCCYVRPPGRPACPTARPPDRPAAGLPARPAARPPARHFPSNKCASHERIAFNKWKNARFLLNLLSQIYKSNSPRPNA